MGPEPDLLAVSILLEADPALAPFVQELALLYDEDLSPHAAFSELADHVSELLEHEGDEMDRLEAIFVAIEQVVLRAGSEVVESVAFGFFDSLAPGVAARVGCYLGPATEALLDRLDSGALDDIYLYGDGLGPELDRGAAREDDAEVGAEGAEGAEDDGELLAECTQLRAEVVEARGRRSPASAAQLCRQRRLDGCDAARP